MPESHNNSTDKKEWIDDDKKDQLKQNTDLIALVKFFGTAGIKPTNNPHQWYIKCVFPDCESKEKDYSMGVNTAKKAFNCFHCGRQGDILKLIMSFKKINFYAAKKYLLAWNRGEMKECFQVAQQKPPAPPESKPSKKIVYQPFRRRLTGLRVKDLPPLEEKGITPKTAEKFGAGYCSQGFMRGRIVVPIYDSALPGTEDHDILAYGGYSVTKRQKEYGDWKFPDDFKKGQQLFNFNRVIKDTKEAQETLRRHGIVVVESFWNVLKLYQAGIKNVVALMGTALTADQEKLLLASTDKVKLWLDNDVAGKKGLQNILRTVTQGGKNGLLYKTHVKIISPENRLLSGGVGDRKKPYEFSEEEIREIVEVRSGASGEKNVPKLELGNEE